MHYLKLINVNEVYNMLLDCCLLVADLVFAIKPACLTNLIRIGKMLEVRLEYDHFESLHYVVVCYKVLYTRSGVVLFRAIHIERGKRS